MSRKNTRPPYSPSASASPPNPASIGQPQSAPWLFDHARAVEILAEKGIPAVCPLCKQTKMSIADRLVEVRPFHGGHLVVGGSLYPHLLVSCLSCGHSMFFNAILMGLIPARPE